MLCIHTCVFVRLLILYLDRKFISPLACCFVVVFAVTTSDFVSRVVTRVRLINTANKTKSYKLVIYTSGNMIVFIILYSLRHRMVYHKSEHGLESSKCRVVNLVIDH